MKIQKDAFIVWTPLHLYNVLRYVLSNKMTGMCDLFYICQSEGMKTYYGILKELGVFQSIFIVAEKKFKSHTKIWEIVSVLFNPGSYVRHLFGGDSTGNDYNRIFISVPTRLNDAIIRSNKFNQVVGYDDGTGSYTTDLYDVSLGKKYELFKKIRIAKKYSIEEIYLNSPGSVLKKKVGYTYNQLVNQPLSDDDILIIEHVFAYHQCESYPRIIFLNQPLSDIGGEERYIEIDRTIF